MATEPGCPEPTRQYAPEGFTIEHGIVRLGAGVTEIIVGDDVRIYEVDCNTKYPQASLGSTINPDGEWFELLLFAGEETLRVNKDHDQPTKIKFPPFPFNSHWQSLCDEQGRYTIRVAFYRRPAEEPNGD